ncbi:MAG: primosomal protein N' [bacterium]
MFVKIIPLIKLPRGMGEFDYAIPENLIERIAVGQLVEIPWRKDEKRGLIAEIHTANPEINLKKVLRIIDKYPFLYKAQIDLLKWASFYYCSSESTFLNMIVPEIPKTSSSRDIKIPPVLTENLKILKSELPKIQKILKNISEQEKTLFHWQDYNNKNVIYVKLLEKFSVSCQIMIIFPQLNHIEKFLKYLPPHFLNKTSILHSEMTKTNYWKEWDKIKKNKTGIIIGAKQAIFSPASNLGVIIIDEEHNSSHKQWDQNPRYNAVESAKKLCEFARAKLILSSNAPSVETYYEAEKNGYKIITESENSTICDAEKSPPKMSADIEIIQMQNEWKEKNYSIFSNKAKNLLTKNISEKKLSIIYLNRKGVNKFIICKDCGYIPQCPNCNLPLAMYEDAEINEELKISMIPKLKCRHCGHDESMTIPCPKCGGANIRYIGTGTQKIENELKKIFPGVKIGKIDLDERKKNIKTLLKNIAEIEILIGTTSLLNYNLSRKSNFILYLNIDTDLMMSKVKATEITMQNLKSFGNILDSNGIFIVQTYNANNPALNFLKKRDFAKYFKNELELRQKMNYPPFSQIIKLTYKHKDSKIVKFESEKLLNVLNKKFYGDSNISILGPVAIPVRFKKYGEEIIIKNSGKREDTQNWLIKNIDADWIIDVDPVEV